MYNVKQKISCLFCRQKLSQTIYNQQASSLVLAQGTRLMSDMLVTLSAFSLGTKTPRTSSIEIPNGCE